MNNFELDDQCKTLAATKTNYALAKELILLRESCDELHSRLESVDGWVTHVSKSVDGGWCLPIYRIKTECDDGALDLLFLTSELRRKEIEEIEKEDGIEIVDTDYLFLDLPMESHSRNSINKIKADAVREWADQAEPNNEPQDRMVNSAYDYADKLERGEL